MKILLLIDALHAGGAETHVVTLAHALTRRGHEAVVISQGGVLEDEVRRGGAAVCRFPALVRQNSLVGLWKNVRFLCRLIRAEHFDVLHAHTRRTAFYLRASRAVARLVPSLRPARVADTAWRARTARRMGAPALVVTAHARFVPRWRRLSFWGEATVAVSEDLANHVKARFGQSGARIRVIPNGIDTTVFYPAERSDNGTLRVTFASRLDGDCSAAAFALLDLVPALASVCAARGRRLSLCLVGGGECYAALLARAEQKKCDFPDLDLTLTGAMSSPADEFRHADIFVGVSRAALEAALCGCAVVLAGDEGFGGVLTEQRFDRLAAENFCCRGEPPLTSGALLDALNSLLSLERPQRAALADAVRRRCLAGWTADQMAERTLSLYSAVLREKRTLRVAVGGYAGCANLGDDAILRRLVAAWQDAPAKRCPTTLLPQADDLPHSRMRLTALVGPQGKQSDFGIPVLPRSRPMAVARLLSCADVFVLGGGALLQNCSPRGGLSLLYYLSLLWLARLLGCPFCLVANGIGPLGGRLARALTSLTLQGAAGISVRDAASLHTLADMGLSTRASVEPDPVCGVEADTERARDFLARLLPAPDGEAQPFLCVAPRRCEDARLTDTLGALLARLYRETGVRTLLVAMDERADRPLCERMALMCGGVVAPRTDERCLAGILSLPRSRSRGMLALRLHALILAHAVNAPALCLPYSESDRKTSDFATSHGQQLLPAESLAEKGYDALRQWVEG